jgi:hypothetical protein
MSYPTAPLEHSNKTDFIRLVFGGIACVTACSFTHPIDLIKIRL